MKELVPYLFFNGNCREAMQFYQQCLGGNLEVMTYGDAPPDVLDEAKTDKDEVMHSNLKGVNFTLMASDWPRSEAAPGNNVHLSIDCGSVDEIDKLFSVFSKEGKIIRPLEDTFWGARFGMLTDKFGIHWMFNFDKQA